MAREKFIEMVERLQKENKGKVVLVRNGIFLCGIGKDAVIMHELLKYKTICFKKEICKMGIPISCFREIIPKLIETGYSYIIYDYNKEKHQEFEIYRIEQEEIYEERTNIECKKCSNYENRIKEPEEYINEIKKANGAEKDERK